MAYEIVIGRSEEEKKQFGLAGAILIGKHYVKMGQITSLSNEVYMDVIKSHVVFICGKRGSGKSYTMGVIAEGMAHLPLEVSQNIAVLMLDTMGVYWTMKYPNKKDEKLLKEWNLEPQKLDIKIFTPVGYYSQFKDSGIPTDAPFSIRPSELSASDWGLIFEVSMTSSLGILMQRVIDNLVDSKENFSLDKIIDSFKEFSYGDAVAKEAAINCFYSAKKWGIFSEEGTEISELIKGGQVTVLDVSVYAYTPGAEGLRALVIGLVSKKLFLQRMIERKKEEYEAVNESIHLFGQNEEKKQDYPLVWLIIDEAHEFLPRDSMTAASQSLITILREGRQPGISLILASQQPGKIHTDVMTQSDIVISHRVTAKVDVEALGMLMQSYMREGLDKQLNYLPSSQGAAIVFDDSNERLYPMRMRPRLTWHGGSSPSALHTKKELFSF